MNLFFEILTVDCEFIVWRTRDECFTRNNDECTCICHGLLKIFHAPAEDRTGDLPTSSWALYHVVIKAGLYRKAVYDIPNLYPVTYVQRSEKKERKKVIKKVIVVVLLFYVHGKHLRSVNLTTLSCAGT